MVSSMNKENGRCAVVLSQGVLFHGNKEAEIVKELASCFYGIEDDARAFLNQIKAVVPKRLRMIFHAAIVTFLLRFQMFG